MQNFSRPDYWYDAPDLQEAEAHSTFLDCGEYGAIEISSNWIDGEQIGQADVYAPSTKISESVYIEFAEEWLQANRLNDDSETIRTEQEFTSFITKYTAEELAA